MSSFASEAAHVVAYGDRSIEFYDRPEGLFYRCPAGCCRAWHWVDTVSGKRHRITSAPGAPLSIVASLQCPCKHGRACLFHVVITDGIARDA